MRTIGDSLTSSVFSLKVNPMMPIGCRAFDEMALTIVSVWMRLDSMVAESIGSGIAYFLAAFRIARRSFGRQEPPKGGPGFRYFGEMFSLVSLQSRDITSRASILSFLQSSPISFAKVTLSAWKQLSAYFTIAADSGEMKKIGASIVGYS